MKLRIHTKLFLAFVLVITASLVIFGTLLSPRFKKLLIQQEQYNLHEESILLSALFESLSDDKWTIEQIDPMLDHLSLGITTRLTVLDKDGRVLGDTVVDTNAISGVENHATRPEVLEAGSKPYGFSIRYSETAKMQMMYVALKVNHGFIRLARPMSLVDATIDQIGKMVLVSYFFSFLLVALLAYFLSRSMSRLLSDMSRVSRQISKGDFTEKLLKTNDDELGEMIDSINMMGKRLDEQNRSISSEKNRLLTVLNAMMEGVVVVDTHKRLSLINPAGIRMLDVPAKYENKSLIECIRFPALEQLIDEVLQSATYRQEELRLTVNKKDFVFVVHVSPLTSASVEGGVVMVLYDVSERQKLEGMRREFVANVSHELKTPLTSILGYAETLQDGAHHDEKTRLSFIDKIVRNANHLKELVDDILELSRIESGKDELHHVLIELPRFVEDIILLYKEKASSRGIEFKVNLDPSQLTLDCDPQSLKQILGNLIDNAIKYNRDHGSVTISSVKSQNTLEISVTDTGMGIPTDDVDRVFERFFRVDKARTRQIEGTGLGLSIVKHMVTRLGGEVGVESTLSKGTRFFFTLPL